MSFTDRLCERIDALKDLPLDVLIRAKARLRKAMPHERGQYEAFQLALIDDEIAKKVADRVR